MSVEEVEGVAVDITTRADVHDLVVQFYREIVFDDLMNPLFDEIAGLAADKVTGRMQEIYSEPIKPELVSERIRQIRDLDKHHNFTLMCRDLSELATYARVTNADFRLLKAHTPGPYTFILNATSEVPRRLMHPKRRTIGMRVPNNPIALALMERLGEPLMTSSLILPGDLLPLTDPYEIRDVLEHQVELVIDGGFCGLEPTTVVDLTEEVPRVTRVGCGPVDEFQ